MIDEKADMDVNRFPLIVVLGKMNGHNIFRFLDNFIIHTIMI